MLWTIISAIVVGAIIGALARLVMPGKQNIGVIMTIVLGILGSLIGSWVCYNLFGYSNEGGGWEFPAFWAVTLLVQALLGDGAFALKRNRD